MRLDVPYTCEHRGHARVVLRRRRGCHLGSLLLLRGVREDTMGRRQMGHIREQGVREFKYSVVRRLEILV